MSKLDNHTLEAVAKLLESQGNVAAAAQVWTLRKENADSNEPRLELNKDLFRPAQKAALPITRYTLGCALVLVEDLANNDPEEFRRRFGTVGFEQFKACSIKDEDRP